MYQAQSFASQISSEVKTCSKCGLTKPISEFYKRTDGRQRAGCKNCHSTNTPGKRFESKLWSHYRLRLEDYQDMLVLQGFKCALCCEDITEEPKKVDHDHNCDHPDKGVFSCKACVRGILCHSCNVLAGWLETRRHLLSAAYGYLGWDLT